MKDFVIASIFASCAFCVAVSASQHATPPSSAVASARAAADPLAAYFTAPSFDAEPSPPQPEPKPVSSADHAELLSAD